MPVPLSPADATAIYRAALCHTNVPTPRSGASARGGRSDRSNASSVAEKCATQQQNSSVVELGVPSDAMSSSSSRQGSVRSNSRRGVGRDLASSMFGFMRAGLRHVTLCHSQKKRAPQVSSSPEQSKSTCSTLCNSTYIDSAASYDEDLPEIAIEILSVEQVAGACRAPRTFSTGSNTDMPAIAAEMPLPEARGLSMRACEPRRRSCPDEITAMAVSMNSSPQRGQTPSASIRRSEGDGPGPVHNALGQTPPHRAPALDGASSGRCGVSPSLQESSGTGTDVALSVYVLSGASVLNKVTELAGIGGAYHVGVEIFCLEWSFGWSPHGTGVHNVYAGCSEGGTFKERVLLGQTPCSPSEVIAILAELREAWPGTSYHLLRRNCAHFSMELVSRLKVRQFPDWVNSLASLIDWLTAWVDGGRENTQALEDKAPSSSSAAALQSNRDGVEEAAAAKQVLASELDWGEAQEYMLERAADAAAARARKQRTKKVPRESRWL